MSTLVGARRKKRRKKKVVATRPVVGAYRPIGVPTAFELLVLNRFGQGYTRAAHATMQAYGGVNGWFEAQLQGWGPENPKITTINSWFGHLWARSPAEKYADMSNGVRGPWQVGEDFADWTLLRRIYSHRSLLETMVGFWSDVLHIPVTHDRAWPYRFAYDDLIRTHALGTFEDLLRETSLSPAMRAYLDNWTSTAAKPNENQGRELLELHTVSRDAAYTEDDVKSSAAILSGYTLDWGRTFEAVYDPSRHKTGPVSVLGFSAANGAQDGRQVTVDYLRYLAHHPQTARTVATRLATVFVSDTPPASLVDRLADAFLSSGTDIKTVLRTLVRSPELAWSQGHKVRTPYADLVATARALQVDVVAPTSSSSWANKANWMHGGMRLYSWPRPDGVPLENAAWCSVSRMFRSYQMHLNQAGGWSPQGASYLPPARRLPMATCTFAMYVDHLCRLLLGRPATMKQQTIAQQMTGLSGSTVITASHAVAGWMFARLGAALLDTPEHMTT